MIQVLHVTFNNPFGWEPGAGFCLRVATARVSTDRGEINNPGCDRVGLGRANPTRPHKNAWISLLDFRKIYRPNQKSVDKGGERIQHGVTTDELIDAAEGKENKTSCRSQSRKRTQQRADF